MTHAGLYLAPAGTRADSLAEAVDGWGYFTQAIDKADYELPRDALALVSLEAGSITHAAIAQRRGSAATGQFRVRLSRFVELAAIPLDDVIGSVSARFRRVSRHALRAGARSIPEGLWSELWSAVARLRPDAQEDLNALERLQARDYPRNGPEAAIVAQERDAVGLALDLFGQGRLTAFDDWAPARGDHLPSFLLGLSQPIVNEDQMLAHDAGVFGDWTVARGAFIGATTFSRGDETLTLMNVNRTPLENTLGVDLLYYHHRYQSFVFVQYKRMTPRTGGPVYRPGGRTYEMELRRMREADLATRTGTAPTTIREYRLWPGAFFFKLCPNVDLDADAAELIKGMYIPLDYWDVLVADARGPRGGAVVTYAGAERWLNNTLFVSLVQDGWIGSAGATTAQLNRIVRAVLEQNHSVIVAVSSVA